MRQEAMTDKQFLAVDLGAESGRGVLASFDGQRIALRELHRFSTGQGARDIGPDGVRRWDFERIWAEIRHTLAEAQTLAPRLDGVAVDSWGVDFGLLDAQGMLLDAPIQYRDASHARAKQDILASTPAEDIWDGTGIQLLPFNTLYQLKARQERDAALLERARHLLLIPDLLAHRLTGGDALGVEMTNAGTTQCLDTRTHMWNTGLLHKLGLPTHFLGNLVLPGTTVGKTKNGVPVYAVGSHDTASAVAAVPALDGVRWAFLSSGTWSLLGAEIAAPQFAPRVREIGFSNEVGANGTTRLLKNIMGLWLVQECRRSLQASHGRAYSYPELAALAEAAPSGGPTFDAIHDRFLAPDDMCEEIALACRETGQDAPQDVGPLIRCCLDSLALAYRESLRALEGVLGQRFDTLHVVGGGSQNRLLNQLTANACGIPVVAGPGEATALGNVLGQLVASGTVENWAEARLVSVRSSQTETFLPQQK